jgi:hypothetical protein
MIRCKFVDHRSEIGRFSPQFRNSPSRARLTRCARGALGMSPGFDPHTDSMLLALLAIWFVGAIVCGPRTAPALISCAPFNTLICWLVWLQAQGWSGTPDDKASLLGEFLLAVSTGLFLGWRARKLLRTPRVVPVEQFAFADDQLAFVSTSVQATPPSSPPRRSFKATRTIPNVSHRLGGPRDNRRAA